MTTWLPQEEGVKYLIPASPLEGLLLRSVLPWHKFTSVSWQIGGKVDLWHLTRRSAGMNELCRSQRWVEVELKRHKSSAVLRHNNTALPKCEPTALHNNCTSKWFIPQATQIAWYSCKVDQGKLHVCLTWKGVLRPTYIPHSIWDKKIINSCMTWNSRFLFLHWVFN